MAKKPDPAEDPKFKSVVRYFLTTKPKPHAAKTKATKRKSARAAK